MPIVPARPMSLPPAATVRPPEKMVVSVASFPISTRVVDVPNETALPIVPPARISTDSTAPMLKPPRSTAAEKTTRSPFDRSTTVFFPLPLLTSLSKVRKFV